MKKKGSRSSSSNLPSAPNGTDYFGGGDPRKMPQHLFGRSISLDYETAIRANVLKQDYGVCPRLWYVDARFICQKCKKTFMWTAEEQRVWFEEYRFWIDSQPRHCRECSGQRRDLAKLKAEYDSIIAAARNHGASDQKRRIIEIVTTLEHALGAVPKKMVQSKELFERQERRAEQSNSD